MGCGGCELFPTPGKVLEGIDQAVAGTGLGIESHAIYKELVSKAYSEIPEPKQGHKNAVNTTNIWHLRGLFLERLKRDHGKQAANAADKSIRQSITCYAATLHANKGQKLLSPDYDGHIGHAPIFEALTRFEGRAAETAQLPDLLGKSNPKTPWKNLLPRLIFVSDMGDALSTKGDFPFLESDLMPAITSDAGKRHLWLWLTKRPARMAEFADKIGGFPPNVCAMTTLTGPDDDSLARLDVLKQVKSHIHGLSIEPLWDRIPPAKLDLTGIDWVILGGESGSGFKFTRPFALEWAEEMRHHCREYGVAFFLKQLGRNPSRNGKIFKLKNSHGGDWNEWPDKELKVREFPKAFHEYRKDDLKESTKPRPIKMKKKKKVQDFDDGKLPEVEKAADESPAEVKPAAESASAIEEKAEFERLHQIVSKGVKGFVEAGEALSQIKERKLWQAGGFATWEDYCRSVAGMSRVHAFRLIKASEYLAEIKAIPDVKILPVSESQVRPLIRLTKPNERQLAWEIATEELDLGKQPTATEVSNAVTVVLDTHGETSTKKTPTRTQQRIDLVSKLRTAIGERKSWDDVEKLLDELGELLSIPKAITITLPTGNIPSGPSPKEIPPSPLPGETGVGEVPRGI